MSIYDLARNPCHAFSAPADSLPGADLRCPIPFGKPLPLPPEPSACPVPIADTISVNALLRLSHGGKTFFRHMIKTPVKHA